MSGLCGILRNFNVPEFALFTTARAALGTFIAAPTSYLFSTMSSTISPVPLLVANAVSAVVTGFFNEFNIATGKDIPLPIKLCQAAVVVLVTATILQAVAAHGIGMGMTVAAATVLLLGVEIIFQIARSI